MTADSFAISYDFSIDCSAIGSDFSTASGEGIEARHFNHGAGEVIQKSCWVGAVSCNLGVRRTPIKELLVRMQEALVLHQVTEVSIVENDGAGRVEWW